MKTRIPIKTVFSAELIKQIPLHSVISIGSWWGFEHWRAGKLIDRWEQKNVNTTEGLNHLLNVAFHAATQITTWYMGLFENDYTPLITNTYAAPGFTESSAYAEGVRQAYVSAVATTKVMTNTASKAVFTMNATKTIYGAFLCGGGSAATTIGDAAGGGVLFASAQFSSSKGVVDTDILNGWCSITLADA